MDSTNATDMALLSAIGGVVAFFLLIGLVITIFFLLTLQKALSRVAPERRTMNPPMVWLSIIPLFNLFWNFMVVMALAKSLGAEFKARNIQDEAEPGKTMGLIWAGLGVGCLIPGLNVLLGVPLLIFWIIYWVKISGFSAKIAGPA